MLLSRSLGLLSIAAIFVFGTQNAASAAESDSVELSNLASCYADGIDMIGNGKTEAGANRWRRKNQFRMSKISSRRSASLSGSHSRFPASLVRLHALPPYCLPTMAAIRLSYSR